MIEEFEDEFIEDLESSDDILYTDEALGIEVMDLEEEAAEETSGGASTSTTIHNIKAAIKKGEQGVFVTLKGYGVQSYFDCTVSPRNAKIGYYRGNQWYIRRPNSNWTGTIRATVTVRADANYYTSQTRKKVKNVITVYCR